MKLNKKVSEVNAVTFEGGAAVKESPEKELTRAVACCMLWEDTFYEKGSELAKRIESLVAKVPPTFVCNLALVARSQYMLRHAPLFLLTCLLKTKHNLGMVLSETISMVIQRPDELTEILAIYWRNGKTPIAAQLKKGIASAFTKFNEYQLAKYNRDSEIKLKDALFLCHAKPKDKAQDELWKRLIDDTMAIPDTWETELSSGKDKKATFTRLIEEGKLGYMALLRNLRNMEEAKVSKAIIRKALLSGADKSKVLPFRYVAAARFAPSYAADISDAMVASLKTHTRIKGNTAILVDDSGSMSGMLSGKSKLTRQDAAGALSVLLREIADARVFVYGTDCAEVPSYRGLGLIESIRKTDHGGASTRTGFAVSKVLAMMPDCERLIVVTDEQSEDSLPTKYPDGFRGYIINCATYEPAMPTQGGRWTRISGFSERVVDWIMSYEKEM